MQYVERAFTLADGGPALPEACRQRFPIGANSRDAQGRQRHLLMLGGSLLQLPAIRMAREEGWAVILADGNPAALARPWVDHFELVDLKDREAMLAMARRWHARGLLHAVFTAGTDFSATVAYVTEALALPGIPFEAALNASSKLRMRRIFKRDGIPSPDFVEIAGDAAADLAAIRRLRLPVVVKPIDNMGSRGVRRLDDWSGLQAALEDARGHSRQGTVIVEEFITGPEYSIDSLVVDGRLIPCGLALRHVRFPPFFVEVGHTLPSDLAPAQAAELVEVFTKAVKSLGITTGAAKGDVFMTPRGPMIGEIAARLSGGYMSGWTFPLASGLELTRAGLYLAMGIPLPSFQAARDLVSCERAVVSIPGRVAAWQNRETALATPGVEHFFSRASPGDRVHFPRNNVEKAGNVIAVAPTRQEASRAAETAVAAMVLRLLPNQPESDAFLFAPIEGQHLAYPALASRLPWDATWDEGMAIIRQDKDLASEADWSWRSLADTIQAINASGCLVKLHAGGAAALNRLWRALAQGGLQGALYALDSIPGDDPA